MDPTLLADLRSPDDETRSRAYDTLSAAIKARGLTMDDALTLVRLSAEPFPESKGPWNNPSAMPLYLARAIARDADPSRLLPQIASCFPKYDAGAKGAALQILTMTGTPDAARLYIKLLRGLKGDVSGPATEFDPQSHPDLAGVLFPGVIECMRSPSLAYPIAHMLLEYRKAGLIPPELSPEHERTLVGILAGDLQMARPLQQSTGLGWRDAEPYVELRDMIGLLFDVAGHMRSSLLLGELERANGLVDPRLRRFRAISLLRQGREVPQEELEAIARSPRDRFWMFEALEQLKLLHRAPAACRDQQRLAEGHMVDWLCFGTELGREPDEIELIRKETRRQSTGRTIFGLKRTTPVDYYFFRFRVVEEHWSKENGWMVGMAGGYARNEHPTTSHDGGTFSQFTPFDEKPIEAHVADYLS